MMSIAHSFVRRVAAVVLLLVLVVPQFGLTAEAMAPPPGGSSFCVFNTDDCLGPDFRLQVEDSWATSSSRVTIDPVNALSDGSVPLSLSFADYRNHMSYTEPCQTTRTIINGGGVSITADDASNNVPWAGSGSGSGTWGSPYYNGSPSGTTDRKIVIRNVPANALNIFIDLSLTCSHNGTAITRQARIPVFGYASRSSVRVIVKSSSGTLLGARTVVLTNTSTGATASQNTSSAGSTDFLNVFAGNYTISVPVTLSVEDCGAGLTGAGTGTCTYALNGYTALTPQVVTIILKTLGGSGAAGSTYNYARGSARK